MASSSVLNFNVGVLGHIDSGKTSLSKALSSVASTAAFDKNPQSQQRGITIDLGFSSFSCDFPAHLENEHEYSTLQFTLVDCPGHSSLIRTIIGGAQIVDSVLLVVDVQKGFQTQTAECLILAEITCDKMVVVLNKTDLLPAEKRTALIDKMTKKLEKTLERTKFKKCPVVALAANPEDKEPKHIQTLKDTLCQEAFIPNRDPNGPFLISIDHCFSIKGQGTVLTGTILQGTLKVNDNVEVAALKITKKVKSMQMFKKPINQAIQGDRIGLCVTQLDPKQIERSLLCSPGYLTSTNYVIAAIKKIPYFKSEITSKSMFHITMMHETVMARITLLGCAGELPDSHKFDFTREYSYQTLLFKEGEKPPGTEPDPHWTQYMLLEFQKPITTCQGSLLIGSHLDYDIHTNVCRLGFHGKVLELHSSGTNSKEWLSQLKVFKTKHKEGVVERAVNEHALICRSLFKKETNINLFTGLKVTLSTGEEGVIEGGFGQSGKVKINLSDGFLETTKQLVSTKKSKETATVNSEAVKVFLNFKRYIYDVDKKMIQ